MEKEEFKVGEVFQYGLAKLRCEKSGIKDTDRCLQCDLYDDWEGTCCGFWSGNCDRREREDKTDVVFKKVEE